MSILDNRPNLQGQSPRPFWQQVLIVVTINSLIVLAGALLLGDLRQVSNLCFWSSVVLLVIAVLPIIAEIGGSARIAGRAIKEGQKVSDLLKEKQATYERRARTTYVFGVAGLVAFVASILSIAIG